MVEQWSKGAGEQQTRLSIGKSLTPLAREFYPLRSPDHLFPHPPFPAAPPPWGLSLCVISSYNAPQ